jgi:hypothetical protein
MSKTAREIMTTGAEGVGEKESVNDAAVARVGALYVDECCKGEKDRQDVWPVGQERRQRGEHRGR